MSDEKLLREAIRLTIAERAPPKNFDLRVFKGLDSAEAMHEYAGKHLVKLGSGSSRTVYLFSSRFVLKVANVKVRSYDMPVAAGMAQNRAEVDVYTNPATKNIVAKVYDFDPEFRWLVSELVRPIESKQEFEALTGTGWREFKNLIDYDQGDWQLYASENQVPDFARAVKRAMSSNQLHQGDLSCGGCWEHFGKTSSGRVVLLDYGATEDVMNVWYS